jgi:hypothetical protein
MRRLAALAVSILAGLTACSPVGPPAAPTTAAAEQRFEAVAVPGSYKVADSFVKLNAATGDAWEHCCGSNNNTFTHIKDDKPLPPGDYRLIVWSQFAPSGDVNYNVYRFDNKTGHTWVYKPGENNEDAWLDLSGTLTWQ